MNIKEICIRAPGNKKTDDEFVDWFNKAGNVENSLRKGKEDFNSKIFDKRNKDLIKETKTCVEIGFGGGRLINEACNHFENVIGIDIHNSFERTKGILTNEGKTNFSLVHRDDVDLIQDSSVDFVYSFVVFQHFDSWDEVEYYLDMIDRILKKDGIAMIYFGNNRDIDFTCEPKRETKKSYWWSSLKVSMSFLESHLERFNIIEIGKNKGSNQIFSRFRKK